MVWQRATDGGGSEVVSVWRVWEGGFYDVKNAQRCRPGWDCIRPSMALGKGGGPYLMVYEAKPRSDPSAKKHIYAGQWWPYALNLPSVLK